LQATFAKRFNRLRGAYAQFLAWQAAEGPAAKTKAYVSMSRGWAPGTKDFKAALIAEGLTALGKSSADATADRKSAPWKVALADRLKQTTPAGNRWLAERLHMGTPVAVGHHTGQLRRGLRPAAEKFGARLRLLNLKT